MWAVDAAAFRGDPRERDLAPADHLAGRGQTQLAERVNGLEPKLRLEQLGELMRRQTITRAIARMRSASLSCRSINNSARLIMGPRPIEHGEHVHDGLWRFAALPSAHQDAPIPPNAGRRHA